MSNGSSTMQPKVIMTKANINSSSSTISSSSKEVQVVVVVGTTKQQDMVLQAMTQPARHMLQVTILIQHGNSSKEVGGQGSSHSSSSKWGPHLQQVCQGMVFRNPHLLPAHTHTAKCSRISSSSSSISMRLIM